MRNIDDVRLQFIDKQFTVTDIEPGGRALYLRNLSGQLFMIDYGDIADAKVYELKGHDFTEEDLI